MDPPRRPARPRAPRHQVRPRQHPRPLRRARPSPERAIAPSSSPARTARDRSRAMVDRGPRARPGTASGRYTSPHLVRLEERFAIDGAPVSSRRARGASAVDVLLARDHLRPSGGLATDPDVLRGLPRRSAFEIFRRAGVDVAVLEVGMGGRFDATNVADAVRGRHHDHRLSTTSGISATRSGRSRSRRPA